LELDEHDPFVEDGGMKDTDSLCGGFGASGSNEFTIEGSSDD